VSSSSLTIVHRNSSISSELISFAEKCETKEHSPSLLLNACTNDSISSVYGIKSLNNSTCWLNCGKLNVLQNLSFGRKISCDFESIRHAATGNLSKALWNIVLSSK